MELICDSNDVIDGVARRFSARNFDLIVVSKQGKYFAYVNECPHMNLPLTNRAKGRYDKNKKHLVCMQHGAEFDIKNGLCVKGPCQGMELESVNTRVINGELFLSD